jgi:5-methylcytosine-specific restriction endonuclease McrA
MPEARVSEWQRQTVIARADGCCEYCLSQSKYSPAPFSIDHILPQILGGQASLNNLAFACLGCNGYKHSKIDAVDPTSQQVVSLFHPRKDQWSEHFTWNETCTHIIGLSSTGRATIEALRLNRISLVNLRRVLFAAGKHPPKQTL